MFNIPYFFGIGLHVIVALFFAVHAVRTGREMYWLLLLFMFPMLGSVVYFFAVYWPDMRIRRGVSKVASAALQTLDPGKALREAEILVEDLKRYAAGNGLPAIEMSSSA